MQRVRRLRASTTAAALLTLALLWAQTLGLLHRVQHAPLPLASAASLAAQSDDGEAGSRWGHDRQSESCKLYDQLALGDAAVPASAAVLALAPDGVDCIETATLPARELRLSYRARAPPPDLG